MVIVKVWKVDIMGNLIFRKMVRNFNFIVVMVGKIMIVEVEEIVEVGEFDLDYIYMLGIYV